MSAGPWQALAHHATIYAHTDAGVRNKTRDRERIQVPFQFNRRNIPYVPHYTRMTETSALTSAFSTRMTAREQERPEPTSIRRRRDDKRT